jgi:hypothetical protein
MATGRNVLAIDPPRAYCRGMEIRRLFSVLVLGSTVVVPSLSGCGTAIAPGASSGDLSVAAPPAGDMSVARDGAPTVDMAQATGDMASSTDDDGGGDRSDLSMRGPKDMSSGPMFW